MMSFDQSGMLPAAVVAVGFALLARGLRAVTDGGAIAGAAVAFSLMLAGGWWPFLPLVMAFFLTLLATRWRAERKRSLGLAEQRNGRNSRQIVANLGVAALCALAAALFPVRFTGLMAAAMAAIAEAAADTVSSEVGQALPGQPRLIIGLTSVPHGTNGAISLEGSLAGCIAASLIAWTAALCGVVPWGWAPILAFAGVAGMLFDSVLGALLENRGKLGNDAVNFVSTIFAADLVLLATLFLARHGA